MKIATWNVNSLRVRLVHLQQLLTQEKPDVIVLQETKVTDDCFPVSDIQALGYHVIYRGQKTYNGVAILSKHPMTEVVMQLPHFSDQACRLIAGTVGKYRIVNVYVPNGSEVGSEKFAYKLAWLKALKQYLKEELKQHPNLLILGDFNIAPADEDVHDPAAWVGSVHVSPEERHALTEIMSLGLVDLFRQFPHEQKEYSWWDYRGMAFRRNHGLRIDLILATSPLVECCQSVQILREWRKLEQPSDHVPVIAIF